MVIFGARMTESMFILMLACHHGSAEPPPAAEAPIQQRPERADMPANTWIRERWNLARADHQWQPPSPIAQSAIAMAIHKLVLAAQSCDAQMASSVAQELRAHGLQMDQFRSESTSFWLVYEDQNGRGHGVYAIRCGAAIEVALQAPHAIYDQWTGAIVRDLFAKQPFRLAMWNTTHRYRATQEEDKDKAEHPADVAHNRDSVFHQVSQTLLLNTTLRFAQLHGFAQDNGFDVILSFGTEKSQPEQLAQHLAPLSGRIGLYGSTASILGATTNVLAKSISEEAHGRFVHIELNKEIRESLKSDGAQQNILAEALKATW